MVQDIYAMYLSHYHIQRVRGHSKTYSCHSVQTVKAFLIKDWMLVLHHMVLLVIFLPITLVSVEWIGSHLYSVHRYYCQVTAVFLLHSSLEEDWGTSLLAAFS